MEPWAWNIDIEENSQSCQCFRSRWEISKNRDRGHKEFDDETLSAQTWSFQLFQDFSQMFFFLQVLLEGFPDRNRLYKSGCEPSGLGIGLGLEFYRLCERFGAFFWTVMGVPWMLDFVAGTLSHRLSMVRFSVCMAGASKARFVHILCCEEYFVLFFWGATLPLWTVHGFWWQSQLLCGMPSLRFVKVWLPPASCVWNRCFLNAKIEKLPTCKLFFGPYQTDICEVFLKMGGKGPHNPLWTSKVDEPSMLVSKVFPFSNRCALIWTPSKQTIFGSSYSPGVSLTRTCAPTQRFSEMRSSAGMESVTRLLPRPWVILFELYRETQSTHRSGWKSTFEHMGRWSNGICTWRHRKDGYFL